MVASFLSMSDWPAFFAGTGIGGDGTGVAGGDGRGVAGDDGKGRFVSVAASGDGDDSTSVAAGDGGGVEDGSPGMGDSRSFLCGSYIPQTSVS